MSKSKNSRVNNTIYNFISSIGSQFLTIFMQFVVRTVFISTLGKSYLGINGLFTNIISMLSLAELGFGSAILYKLYDPLAEGNKDRISALMRFYKTVYRYIGLIVALVGVSLIPFLSKLINDYDKLNSLDISVAFIYCLYLLQSVSSYLFFSYKSAIVRAQQKEYLLNVVSYIFTIGASILQIICLLAIGNFELYVAILVIQTIGQNIAFALIADKLYPYINNKPSELVSKKEATGIFKDCGALFLYSINSVVVKSTDNIVISVFLGLEAVGMYSNYYIFYTTTRTLFMKIFNSVSHSIGNLHAMKEGDHEYDVFESVIFVASVLGGIAFIGIALVADEFISTWIGDTWSLGFVFSVLLGLELYTASYKIALNKYCTTMGLFQQAKFRPVASMIINLVVSIVLVNYLGIMGVLIGTIASDWLTFMWFDPLIIHNYGFGKKYKVKVYYIKYIKYFVIVLTTGVIDYFICNHFMVGKGWASVLVHSSICGFTVPLSLFLGSKNSKECKFLYSILKKKLFRKNGGK